MEAILCAYPIKRMSATTGELAFAIVLTICITTLLACKAVDPSGALVILSGTAGHFFGRARKPME